jgi:uncharacterized membrane protein YphA (DoxX/SURF4 family)/peroxiredoxin
MTEVALLAARLTLAAVFAVAAAAKLVDREATRNSMAEFGVPGRLVEGTTVALPLVELSVAGLLVASSTASRAADAALALLLLFAAAVGLALARGLRPDCGCFGARSQAIGWRTLARNLVLAGDALAVALAGPGRHIGAPSSRDVVEFLLAGAFAAQAWFGFQLFRQNGRLLQRVLALEAVTLRKPAAPFTLPDVDGDLHSLAELLAPGIPLMLLFADPECPACDRELDRLAGRRDELAGTLEIVAITRAGSATRLERLRAYDDVLVLVQARNEVFEAYDVVAVPSGIIVDGDGLIASPLATGSAAIDELLARQSAAPSAEQVVSGRKRTRRPGWRRFTIGAGRLRETGA